MIRIYNKKYIPPPQDISQEPHYHELRHDFEINNVEIPHGTSMPYFHYHNVYELYYMKYGTKRYIINDIIYDLEPYDLVIIRPGEIHRGLSCTNDPQQRVILYFSERFMDRFADITKMHGLLDCLSQPFLSVPAKYRLSFGKLIERMCALDMRDLKDPVKKALMQCRMFELLCMLTEIARSIPGTITDNETVTRAVDFIEKNYMNPLTLADTAREVFVSPPYLSALFKKCTGTNFASFVKELRIRRAIDRLTSADESISKIAAACGFTSANYFKDVFRDVTGLSPSAYRRAAREGDLVEKLMVED